MSGHVSNLHACSLGLALHDVQLLPTGNKLVPLCLQLRFSRCVLLLQALEQTLPHNSDTRQLQVASSSHLLPPKCLLHAFVRLVRRAQLRSKLHLQTHSNVLRVLRCARVRR